MGSPSRFQACEPHMPFQCQSNAASSLINWLDIFTKTLKTATTICLCQVIHNKAEWTKWEDILNTNASLPRDVYAGNMIIPTLDTVRWMEACFCKIWTLHPIPHRYQHILSLLASHDKPFLLVGPSGTGKTVYIKVAWSPLLLSIKSIPPPLGHAKQEARQGEVCINCTFLHQDNHPENCPGMKISSSDCSLCRHFILGP